MNRFKNIEQLETVFIDKLSEKFKLTERDLKRAFIRFDTNKNGLLDLDELRQAVKSFVNGVPDDQVDELMVAYDRSGDGNISYEELLHALTTRSATKHYFSKRNNTTAAAVVAAAGLKDARGRSSAAAAAAPAPRNAWGEAPVERPSARPSAAPARPAAAAAYHDDMNSRSEMTEEEYYDDVEEEAVDMDNIRGKFDRMRVKTNDDDSERVSEVDMNDDNSIENKLKSYLRQLKLYLFSSAKKHAYSGRPAGGRGDRGEQHDNIFGISAAAASAAAVTKTDRLTNTHGDLVLKISRDMLFKCFEPFTGPPPFTKYIPLINFSQFAKGLRSLVIPGIFSLKTEMLEYFFELCIEYGHNPIYSNSNFRVHIDEEEAANLVDVRILVDLVLGDGKERLCFLDHCNEGRSSVGYGPIKKPTATEANNSKITKNVVAQANSHKENPITNSKLAGPMRFISRRARSILTVPSGFGEESWIKRSSEQPDYTLVRDHVFGMSSTLQSGSAFYLLPSSLNKARSGVSNSSNPNYLDSSIIVYPSAAMGVVHDLSNNRQFYFDKHSNDITAYACAELSNSEILVATGTSGKYPELFLWSYNVSNNTTVLVGSVKRELNLFSRSVTLILLSTDCQYMYAIGGDDHHTMFVFSLESVFAYIGGGYTGEPASLSSIMEISTQNGIPPMVKNSCYCPYFDYCDYIDRDHAGLCDLFCTVGERHIRIWSFKRPSPESGNKPSLKFRSPVPGKVSDNLAPKTYTCCAFIPPSSNSRSEASAEGIASCDLVTGGSNGLVFLYRRGTMVAHNKAIKGGVTNISCMGDKLVVGGAKCIIRVMDAKTLNIMQSFDGYASYAAYAFKAPKGTAQDSNALIRPSSAASTAVQVVRGRPSSANPTMRRNSDVSSVASGNIGRQNVETRSIASSQSSRSRPQSSASSVRSGVSNTSSSSQAANSSSVLDDVDSVSITGLGVVPGASRSSSPTLLVTLSNGVAFKLSLSSSSAEPVGTTFRANRQIWTASEKSNFPLVAQVKPIFYFHTNDVYGICADNHRAGSNNINRVMATTGDDRRLCVWNINSKTLVCRTLLEAAGKCCFFDKSNCFLAVGCSSGSFFVYALVPNTTGSKEFSVSLVQKAFRRDSQEDITEIKIAPNNAGLVTGSRDNCIYVYNLSLQNPGEVDASVSVSPVIKLTGHTSYIRQIDYSSDSKLLLSTCGAHELLCWQLPVPGSSNTGGLNMNINISDINWKTNNCIFGFPVMGIWPSSANNNNKPYDGTDINAIDVCKDKGLVVVADDFGKVSMLNYPCIVQNAPSRVFYGHSSFVTGVRVSQGNDKVVSIGGHDCSTILWRIEAAPQARGNPFGKAKYTNIL